LGKGDDDPPAKGKDLRHVAQWKGAVEVRCGRDRPNKEGVVGRDEQLSANLLTLLPYPTNFAPVKIAVDHCALEHFDHDSCHIAE
jgi:hypothetical protein